MSNGIFQSEIWHSDGDSNRAAIFVPACRTPFPVARKVRESCADWILMHVGELLFYLVGIVNLEAVISFLPDWIVWRDLLKEGPFVLVHLLLDKVTRLLFPVMQKIGKLFFFWKPDKQMDMVRHQDKAKAIAPEKLKRTIQARKYNAICLIKSENLSPFIAAECHKMDIQLFCGDVFTTHS